MKLFLLETWYAGSKPDWTIIRAESSEQARNIAFKSANKGSNRKHPEPHLFRDENRTTCTEIKLTGKPSTIAWASHVNYGYQGVIAK